MGILTFQLGTFGELFKFLSLQHALQREREREREKKSQGNETDKTKCE